MNKTILRSTAFILSSVLLTVCAWQTPQTPSAPTATPTATAVRPLTATAALEGSTPMATAAQPPALEGDEWLLVNTEQGLWAVRPDGSESVLRVPGRVIVPGPFSGAVSSADGLIAYLTTSDPGRGYGNFPNLTLNIVSLLGRGPAAAIPLTSPETEPKDEFPDDISRAMVEQPSFAWSPEGKRLAYIGAEEGPSADLYEYYRESGDIVRLTDGPDQAYRPQWSPDGMWIVHAAASTFGTGAGIGVTGFYAARADGGGLISLYDIGGRSGGEVGAGWLDSTTLVAHTWSATCGPNNLRLVDLAAQKADLVFEGCLSAVAAGPGSVLFAQSPDTAAFDENPRPGLYLLTAADRMPHLIRGDNVRQIAWVEGIRAFLVQTSDNRLLEVSPAGGMRTLPANGSRLPTVSPGGRWWAYAATDVLDKTSGVFAGEYGKDPAQIFDGEIAPGQMIFSPGGNALYYLTTSGNLYRAQAPDWIPALLVSGWTPASYGLAMAWIKGG
jgi:hypothetical protein